MISEDKIKFFKKSKTKIVGTRYTRSDTNRAVQLQKMARGLKFRIYEVEGLYYPCSENKGADQLCGYREADLRPCFRIYAKTRFSHDAAHMLWMRF